MNRAIMIVLDSVGIGALPDAEQFNDTGAHTLGHIYLKFGQLAVPNMYKLGLSRIQNSMLPPYDGNVCGAYGRASEKSNAKDTVSGHWELMGLISPSGFKVYENGFPQKLMDEFEHRIGTKTLGNCPASGTEIIQKLGDEHLRTGYPIVYTSADSVFQIAAHEDAVGIEHLYEMCQIARELLDDGYNVCRVIARPFVGNAQNGYTRTENRRDYAVEPTGNTYLDKLTIAGYKTVAIGKIEDIFAHRGIGEANHTRNNYDGIEATLCYIRQSEASFIFVNLVDFDMLYGHRNDARGYKEALEYFDARLPEIIQTLRDDDLLIITADHGCDPTHRGTDHTREYIPVLIYSKRMKNEQNIGTLDGFGHIGKLAYEYITSNDIDVNALNLN